MRRRADLKRLTVKCKLLHIPLAVAITLALWKRE